MISRFFEYNRDFLQVVAIILLVLLSVFVLLVISDNNTNSKNNISENEQTLNAYATFESTCSYRGYDRSECLQIWGGR